MAFKYLTGPLMNLVGSGEQYGATPSGPVALGAGSVDSSYPLANLYDGLPALPLRLSAVTTGTYVSFVNNRVLNGDMEQGTTGWTAASATLTSESGAGNFHKGSKSAKLVTTGAGGYIYQDVTVQAGQYLQIWAAAKSDGTNDAAVLINCLDTNQNLSSDGAWAAVGTVCMTKTGNTMTAFTPVTFRAPTFAEAGRSTVTLRVLLQGEANAQTLYFDEVMLIPGIDFVGLFGHGFDSAANVALSVSGASYWHSPSFAASFTGTAACAKQVAVVVNSSRVYDPFPAVFLYPGGAYGTYSTLVAPWIGELVVGQMSTMPSETTSLTIARSHKGQNRQQTRGGTSWVYNSGKHSLRKVTIGFFNDSVNDTDSMVAEMMGMTEGGVYPLILLPSDMDASAIYGRVSDSMSFSYQTPQGMYSTTEVVVEEEALPSL